MRKFSRTALILAAVTGVAGIGMTVGGAAMGATIAGLNIGKYAAGETVKKVAGNAWADSDKSWDMHWDDYEIYDPETVGNKEVYNMDTVSAMDLRLSTDQLEFQECEDDKISIEVTGDKKDKIRVGKDDDTLVMESIGKCKSRSVLIRYPKGTKFENTSIEIAAGTVEMQDDFATDDMDIDVAAGEFRNKGRINANDVDISVGTGNVELYNLKATDLEADCGVGNMSLEMAGAENEYSYEISCGAGCVKIGDNTYEGLGHEQNIDNSGASGNMELDCGIGNIDVSFKKA